MRIRYILLSALAAAPALADPAPIIGGTTTTVGEYPSVVALEIGQGLCTGILITKDWVLTAGHCVDPSVVGEPNQAMLTAHTRVHFNSVNINSAPGMVVNASDTIMDPMFNVNALGAHDMGLIKLATPVTTVAPSPVNLVAASAPIGTVLTMVGFGTTQAGGTGGAGVEYDLRNRMVVACGSLPQGAGAGLSDANLLCYAQTDGKGKCEGDSGGPSFAMINGKATVVGVTSFGDQSCTTFGTDTRTDIQSAFLLAHIPELQCTTDADCAADKTCFQHACIAQPFATGGLGATCTGGTDCDTGTCGTNDGTMKCSATCTVGAADACPAGFDCLGAAGAAGACWPHADGGGCCDAGRQGAPTMLFGIGLVGLVLRRRRR